MAKRGGETSSSGEQWPPEVLPEHTIFLSHCGHEKPFVERLCEELKRMNHSPFFDQNFDSLPLGERFPPHIFKAAEQCLLAVIVLSEGYLTSKWPMLELAAFVKAKETKNPNMKLLPLFYKLSPSDLVPEKWMESWKKLAEDAKLGCHALEIESWSKGLEVLMQAKNVEIERMKSLMEHDEQDKILPDDFSKLLDEVVKDLRPFSGLEFSKYGTSEGRYIQAVVDEICEIIPPMMKYSVDGIYGYQRMCEKVSSLFEEGSRTNDVCKPRRLYLGLYGMGGVGKTTLCVAMCNFYQAKFRGRVCHVELQDDVPEERIERLKYVIRQLGGLDDKVVEKIRGESQGLQCLKDQLKRQPPTFLAVDNVGDSESSRDEARRFISCGLACGSKVMVTSRSRIILESVLREAKYCKRIPRLEEQEAEELFLSVAIPQKMSSSLQPNEDVIVKACVQEGKFLDDGYDTDQYHPLVLRALGTFFHDVDKDDILEWEEALNSNNKLHASRESKHVNDILGLNYATLFDGQKLLFLDVVFLFNLQKRWLQLVTCREYFEDDYKWAISLIAAMHGISTFDARMKVKELQRKSLIYESNPSLRAHDLYIDFGLSMMNMEGTKENLWWVHGNASRYNPMVKRILLLEDALICHRLMEMWECLKLECLIMNNRKMTLKSKLGLESFPNLHLLIISNDIYIEEPPIRYDMEIFYGPEDENEGCLAKLLWAHLSGFDLKCLPFLRHCWNLTFLSIKDCHFDVLDFTPNGISLFENLKALETLILASPILDQVPSCVLDGILQGAKELKSLKYLEIDLNFGSMDGVHSGKLDFSLLGPLTSLQTLSLPRLPKCIKELMGLDQLSQLTKLNLEDSHGLRKLPNLHLLPNLRRICIQSCVKLAPQEDQFQCFQKFHSGRECLSPTLGVGPNIETMMVTMKLLGLQGILPEVMHHRK